MCRKMRQCETWIAMLAMGMIVSTGYAQQNREGPLRGDDAASAGVRGVAEAAGKRPSVRPDIEFVSDASLVVELEPGRELAELEAEAAAMGTLFLRDGDFLGGRIVAQNIYMETGARIYVEDGAVIIATGDLDFSGALIPVPREDDEALSIIDVEDSDGSDWNNGVAGDDPTAGFNNWCGGLKSCSSTHGANATAVSMSAANVTIGAATFAAVCAGPQAGQIPADVTCTADGGKHSAKATGGNGGNGAKVTIRASNNLDINGPICNGEGADGADATATATIATENCRCGGDAVAKGGRGGNAGDLSIRATNINWNVGSSLTVKSGGAGGTAMATAADATSGCPCGETGKPGGGAEARGGKAPIQPPSISVQANNWNIDVDDAIDDLVTIEDGKPGGNATATAGDGGDGGELCDCPEDGGPGGRGGNAKAIGGDGEEGKLLSATENNDTKASKSANGGKGGDAASHAGMGGKGGDGGTCPCTYEGQAGNGGRGGWSGRATSLGGRGGKAKKGSEALNTPTSGDGGDAQTADCQIGGNGGAAGSCIDEPDEGCEPGARGPKGRGGKYKKDGGDAGTASNGANSGDDGLPLNTEEGECADGSLGDPGIKDCEDPPPPTCPPTDKDDPNQGCVVPHDTPGCNDDGCCGSVCEIEPICCEVAWFDFCVNLAQDVCDLTPVCGDGICEPGEEVDCPQDCSDEPCGNGVLDPGEACEPGVQDCPDGFWCDACQCLPLVVCGDGICEPGEEFDCPQDCDGSPFCGNGICEPGEEVDCPQDCGEGPVCGNGLCEPGEEPGGPFDCSIDCHSDPFCGDGVCQPGEEFECPQDCDGSQGCPGQGDCYQPHDTPGCQDPFCCNMVCGIDPFCCDVSWDALCVEAALDICPVP